ncbi:hypothetical protein K439DRAFT_1638111 [Ramaria rubella]|nr:hypothetical protein K439DRAFT_1638111 [Ramaria rubella]
MPPPPSLTWEEERQKDRGKEGERDPDYAYHRDGTTPPMSPYTTTGLALWNYAPPGGVVLFTPLTPSMTSAPTPISMQTATINTATTLKPATTTPTQTSPMRPPTPYGSLLSTPPASRSSSDSDIVGAGGAGADGGVGAGAGEMGAGAGV